MNNNSLSKLSYFAENYISTDYGKLKVPHRQDSYSVYFSIPKFSKLLSTK